MREDVIVLNCVCDVENGTLELLILKFDYPARYAGLNPQSLRKFRYKYSKLNTWTAR